MAANSILPFGATASNELTTAAYTAEAQRLTGNQPGKASSKLNNKVLHQTSLIAAGLAQFLADRQVTDVADTLTPAQIATMLAAVLNGPNLLTTPPQFDNDASPATTQFVQRALGSTSSVTTLTATTPLTAAHVGQLLQCFGGASSAITLPPSAGLTPGARVEFWSNATAPFVVYPQGADVISNGLTFPASITLNAGDTVVLTFKGAGVWLLNGGTIQLPTSSGYASVKASNGYQKLPSGLILQWGGLSGLASYAVSFPIAFPTGPLALFGTPNNASGTVSCTAAFINAASFALYLSSVSSAYWFAIGW